MNLLEAPPLRTPFSDLSVLHRLGATPPEVTQAQNLADAWQRWLKSFRLVLIAKTQVILDTHANRVKYNANQFLGQLFAETDRHLFYSSNGTGWIYLAGTAYGTLAARFGDLGPNDAGVGYVTTDTFQTFQWSGLAWVAITSPAGAWSAIIQDISLNQPMTPIVPPDPSTGAEAIYILRQPPAGGAKIQWQPGFAGTSSNIDTTANTISTFRFVYSAAQQQWVLVGQPTTGMIP